MLQQLVEPAGCSQLAGCRVCMRGLLERCLQLLGRLLGLDWSACRTHVGSCKFSCHYAKTDVQHRQPSTCSPPEECEAEPVGPANFPETGQIRRHITCGCCSDLLRAGKHSQTSIGL